MCFLCLIDKALDMFPRRAYSIKFWCPDLCSDDILCASQCPLHMVNILQFLTALNRLINIPTEFPSPPPSEEDLSAPVWLRKEFSDKTRSSPLVWSEKNSSLFNFLANSPSPTSGALYSFIFWRLDVNVLWEKKAISFTSGIITPLLTTFPPARTNVSSVQYMVI